jgi:TRAP transporter TAXI family solute receptor
MARLFRKRWLVVIAPVALVLAAFAIYYVVGPHRLTVAVGPPDGPEARLIEAYAAALEQQRAGIRVRVVKFNDLRQSGEALQRNEVDLAVVRPDVLLPVNGLSMAILREEAVIIVAPDASKIEDPGDLGQKRLGLIARHDADRPFVEAILAHYDVAPPAVTIVPVAEEDVTAALAGKKVDALAFVAAPTGAAAESLIKAVEKGTGGKMKVVPVDQADSMAQRWPTMAAIDIPAGALGGRPKQPREEVKTVGVSYRLMARPEISRITVAEATQHLFQMRPRLAVATSGANQMKALDTDTATGAALPIHPGAIDYFAREQLTFMDRYGDWLWLALFSMGGISSAAAWLAQNLARRRRELVDEVLDSLTCIVDEAREAKTPSDLDQLSRELDALVTHAIRCARHRSATNRTLSALTMAIEAARAALADRRRELAEEVAAVQAAGHEKSRRIASAAKGRA